MGGGELFSVIITGTLQHDILWGIIYCIVMTGAVLPWNEYFGYSYSFYLGAVSETITVM